MPTSRDMALMGYDPARNQYTGTWMDSFRGFPITVASRFDPGKKAVVRDSDIDAGGGNIVKIRQVQTYPGGGKRKLEQFLLLEGNPVKTMEIFYLRRIQKEED